MKRQFGGILGIVLIMTLGLAACGEKKPAVDENKENASAEVAAKEKEALDTAVEAYVYAYPLVTMEYTRRALTNTATPEETKAPMGQFVRMREYPNASFKDVTAPNADTLYTQAWFDVAKEPWVVSCSGYEGSLLFVARCSTVGPRCSMSPANVPRAPARKLTRSRGRAGTALCPRG